MYILVVAGPRDWKNKEYVWAVLDLFIQQHSDLEKVISGDATGVDLFTKEWAEHRQIPFEIFEADWDRYKSGAGPIRNKQMAQVGDVLVAFRYPHRVFTAGTKSMIDQMVMRGKVIYFSSPFDQYMRGWPTFEPYVDPQSKLYLE